MNDGTRLEGDIIVSSIPIEEVCENRLGDLPYAGRDFIPFVLPCKEVCPGNLRFLHYTQKEAYTRIVEYKKLTNYESPDTFLGYGDSHRNNGKLYPYMITKYLDRAKAYMWNLFLMIFIQQGVWERIAIQLSSKQLLRFLMFLLPLQVNLLMAWKKNSFQIGDKNIVKDRQSTDSNAVTVAENGHQENSVRGYRSDLLH